MAWRFGGFKNRGLKRLNVTVGKLTCECPVQGDANRKNFGRFVNIAAVKTLRCQIARSPGAAVRRENFDNRAEIDHFKDGSCRVGFTVNNDIFRFNIAMNQPQMKQMCFGFVQKFCQSNGIIDRKVFVAQKLNKIVPFNQLHEIVAHGTFLRYPCFTERAVINLLGVPRFTDKFI